MNGVLPIDSFQSSDLMQMRSQAHFSQEKLKESIPVMFMQD